MSFLLSLFVTFLVMGVAFTAFMTNPVLTVMVIAAIVIAMMFPIQVLIVLGVIAAAFFALLRN